ncbi:unnamed protein product, partial [Heterotrigona itama]
ENCAFSLLIDDHMLERVISCTELEASRVLGKKFGILKWGPNFFFNTVKCLPFTKILRFIRFDKKSDGGQRLQSDKFVSMSI